MDKEEKTSPFWTTLPGILTGVAALVTAITGLTLGLYQYGVLGSKQDAVGKPTRSGTSPQGTSTAVSSGQMRPTDSVSDPTKQGAQQATAVITAGDGRITTVFADNFRQTAQYDAQLHLLSGQAIAFDKIKSIEVVKVYAQHAEIRIALVDDRVINASLGAGSSIYGFGGENELGGFSITVDQLKRIVFRR